MGNRSSLNRALVTGATGFIGSHLVRCIEKQGWDVHILARTGSDLKVLGDVINRITVHRYEATMTGMIEVMATAKPDIVFHLASQFISNHKSEDIDRLVSSNLLFSTQILEAMMRSGVINIVNVGTSWQHYHSEDYSPVNLYAATKQAFESILTYYIEAHGLKATTLLLFDTYGPNDPREKIIPLLWKVATTRQPLIMSPGEQLIELVYVDDVVRAFILAAEALIKTQALGHTRYGVSANKPIRLIDLVREFELVINDTLPIEFGQRPYRPREVMKPWSSHQRVPGWAPETELKVGIASSRPAYLNDSNEG
jgi:nucleoside-diphosphate-sugar epimerase